MQVQTLHVVKIPHHTIIHVMRPLPARSSDNCWLLGLIKAEVAALFSPDRGEVCYISLLPKCFTLSFWFGQIQYFSLSQSATIIKFPQPRVCGLLMGKSSSAGDPDSTPQRVFTSVCRSASLSDYPRNGEFIDSYTEICVYIYIHMSIQCINAQIHTNTNTYVDSKWASLSNMMFSTIFNFNVHHQKSSEVLPYVCPKKTCLSLLSRASQPSTSPEFLIGRPTWRCSAGRCGSVPPETSTARWDLPGSEGRSSKTKGESCDHLGYVYIYIQ